MSKMGGSDNPDFKKKSVNVWGGRRIFQGGRDKLGSGSIGVKTLK